MLDKMYGPMSPRFMPGKFGQSLLVEYGGCACDVDAGKNLLEETPTPLNGSKLTPLSHGLPRTPCVEIVGERPGLSIGPVPLPEAKDVAFSMYLKGESGQAITVGTEKDTVDVTLTGAWQRVELHPRSEAIAADAGATGQKNESKNGIKTRQNVTFSVQSKTPGTFQAAAPMLEKLGGGYAGKSTASTWLPPLSTRPGDRLEMPPPTKTETGTVTCWFKMLGKVKWRRLISFDASVGWPPLIAVDMKDGQTATLGKSTVKLPTPLDDDNWHHLVLRWQAGTAELFIDNVKRGEADIAPLTAPLHLGGTSNDFSPALRADALFDEFAQWDRPLTDAEIAALTALPGPLGGGLQLPLRLHDKEVMSVFARDDKTRNWNVELRNLGEEDLDSLTVSWGVEGVFRSNRSAPALPGKSAATLPLEWQPALLMPGKYRFFVEVAEIRHTRDIEISPARTPRENAQVIIWGGNGREYQELGVSTAGVAGIKAAEIDEANRNRLYSMIKVGIQGKAATRDDYLLNISGKPHNVDQRAPAPLASLTEQAARLGANLQRYPDIRDMIVNTEHLWVDGLDFRPQSIKEARERFGLDLSTWLALPEKDYWCATLPGGRLAPGMGGLSAPVDGIVPPDDPLLSYMRWWHSDQAGNEIFLNDLVATVVRRNAPWVKSIAEPALRRPALRAFKAQDIIEEWFYFENPRAAISVQEKLAAAARGTGSQIAGMPQFLFKPGGAAPYRAMPPPDLFRETMWLCLSRPLGNFTFWGMWSALHPEKGFITQDKIDKLLKEKLGGKEVNFENVKAVIKTEGENSEISLFVPELRGEISHMLNDVVNPLGALLPQWRNRPRQIALYVSFAGQLYSDIRWPRTPPILDELSYPYDVLYDQDFEENPNLLDGYQAVVLQECAAVAAAAAPQMERFAARGGLLLADEHYRGGVKEAVVINYGKADVKAENKLKATHVELLQRHKDVRHPQYIEGMEQAAAELKSGPAPVEQALAVMTAHLRPEVETSVKNVRFNTLKAAAANYLVAVNDLRTRGRLLGQYGRVLEQGLPLEAVTFRMSRSLGKAAYELLACKEIELKSAGEGAELSLDLPPAGGRIVVFLPERIKELQLEMPTLAQRGEFVTITAALRGESGQPVPGILPAKLDVIRPEGSRDCFSRHVAITDGRFMIELPIPLNAPPGVWRISLEELASGKTGTGELSTR